MPNKRKPRALAITCCAVPSSEGVTVGPVLMGVAKPAHILTPIASVRRIVNMVALAGGRGSSRPAAVKGFVKGAALTRPTGSAGRASEASSGIKSIRGTE